VTRRDQPAAALETVREVLGADEGASSATFMRGLTLGALLGAAIAGSALWRRARASRTTPSRRSAHETDEGAGPAEP
jgi:hypothetical protein